MSLRRVLFVLAAGTLTAIAPLRGQAEPADTGAEERVRECVRRCPGGEQKPVLHSLPNLWEIYGGITYPMDRTATREFVLLRFVVDTGGKVRLGSIEVLSSTAQRMEDAVRQALLQARFRPALADGKPVPARVQLRIEFRKVGGEGRVTYRVSGP